MKIDGKTALVTGGASGLGKASAEALLDAGASVVIVDLARSKGQEVAEEMGKNVRFAAADVSNEEEVAAAVQTAVTEFGELHMVVHCAGIGWAGRVVDREGNPHPLDRFEFVIRTNLIGTFNVVRLSAAQMVKQEVEDEERGVIVNTASVAAFDGQIGQTAYSASKGGVVGMTLPMARDLAPAKIRVVTIAPGLFDTPLMALLPEPQRQALAVNIPHPSRLGRAEEYGALARHIVENPMINGETIRLDGALRMPPR